MDQNFKNHSRFNPLFHFILIPGSLLGLFFSIRMALHQSTSNNFIVVAVFLLLIILALVSRESALKAQDRAILSQEHIRYYVLSGKQLPNELTIKQIIAVRFASDAELISLVDRAIAENLSGKEIKMAIKNWRGDHHRV